MILLTGLAIPIRYKQWSSWFCKRIYHTVEVSVSPSVVEEDITKSSESVWYSGGIHDTNWNLVVGFIQLSLGFCTMYSLYVLMLQRNVLPSSSEWMTWFKLMGCKKCQLYTAVWETWPITATESKKRGTWLSQFTGSCKFQKPALFRATTCERCDNNVTSGRWPVPSDLILNP